MALQALGAQQRPGPVWSAHLRVHAYASQPVAGRGTGFAGGAALLSTPADRGGIDRVTAGLMYDAAALGARVSLHAGEAVDAWAARAGEQDARRFLHQASIEARSRGLTVGAGVFPSRLSASQDANASDAALSPSMLRDLMPWRHGGTWARVRALRILELETQALTGWEFIGDARMRGFALLANLAPARFLNLRGYHLRAPHGDSPLRKLTGGAFQGRAGSLDGVAEIQLGSQENSSSQGRAAHWWSYVAAARWRLSPRAGWTARFERFDDDKQIVLPTGAWNGAPNAPMRGYSETIGVHVATSEHLLWRAEARGFQNSGASFPGSRFEGRTTLAWVMAAATLAF